MTLITQIKDKSNYKNTEKQRPLPNVGENMHQLNFH